MAFGGGPGMSTRSRFPGDTAGSVSVEVVWMDSCEVVWTVVFGELCAM